jgi:hypothetical protein
MEVSIMKCLPISLVLTVATASFAGAEDTRSLDAHEHGVGQLDIAIDGGTVVMTLAAPGADIVGFEHAAGNDADRAAVETALADLALPFGLFEIPAAAGCEVVSVEATLLSGDEDDHHDDDHGHDHGHEDDHAEDHAGEHGGEPGGEHGGDGHTEFRADYTLTCADPAAIDRIGFPYFDRFPGAREIDVQMVTGNGARAYEVTRDRPTLDLGGAI